MRRILFSLIFVALALLLFGSSSLLSSKAKGKAAVMPQGEFQPGTRCFRQMFERKTKKRKTKKSVAAPIGVMPGTRCTRLSSGGKPGTLFPNVPPKIGLASSTAYIAANAVTKVDLKAIACDADGDNLLYTYSATGGRVTGEGEAAVWDLSGVMRPASYRITVEVDDGCGCVAMDSTVVSLE